MSSSTVASILAGFRLKMPHFGSPLAEGFHKLLVLFSKTVGLADAVISLSVDGRTVNIH